jgi:hypothetical protein
MNRNPDDAYKILYQRGYIETGPRLVSRRNRTYRSFQDMFDISDPFLGRIDGGRGFGTVDVPTPWHALAVCFTVQQRLLDDGRHVVFRGQSNSSYPIVASIYRQGLDAAAEVRANDLIAWFFATTAHQFYGSWEPKEFYPAVQHYKGKTNLLDFTPDPAVAVWFATRKRVGQAEQGCPTASVWIIRLDSARTLGGRILLCLLPLSSGFTSREASSSNATLRIPCRRTE